MRGHCRWSLAWVLIAGVAQAVEPQGRLIEDIWNAAYLGGAKAGFVRTSVHEIELDGQKVLRSTLEFNLTLKRFQDTIQLRMETGSEETPQGEVVGVFTRQYLGKQQQMVLSGKVVGDQLQVEVDGGKRMKKSVPWDPAVLGLHRQEHMFQERKVKPGDSFSYSSYEPTIVAVVHTRVAVKDFEEVEVFGEKKRLLRVEAVSDKIAGVQLPRVISWLNDDRVAVRSQFDMPELGQLTLYRGPKDKVLRKGPETAKLPNIGIASLIRINRRVPNPYAQESVVYRLTVKDDDNATEAIAKDGRQEIKNVKGNSFELHVRASRGPRSEATDEKIGEEFILSNYFINCEDERVREHARKAVGKETDAWQKAVKIEKYVFNQMTKKNLTTAFATADEVARTLEGDCTEHAMLAAAMCRAAEVPSRVAVGLIYVDLAGGPHMGFHMWTEVWVRGQWIPIDGTLGQGFVGATHLKIADHSWHDTQSLTPLLPVMRVLGKLSIEVVRLNIGNGRDNP